MADATWSSNPWLWVISFKRLDVLASMRAGGVVERPILFRGSMVRAILEGRKTQTRRVAKLPPPPEPTEFGPRDRLGHCHFTGRWQWQDQHGNCTCSQRGVLCPYASAVGDRLWVRETWQRHGWPVKGTKVTYRADYPSIETTTGWRPSIHMPRWACRLVLEVTDVRVERLQEISEEDAKAEGVDDAWALAHRVPAGRDGFRSLWESIHGA